MDGVGLAYVVCVGEISSCHFSRKLEYTSKCTVRCTHGETTIVPTTGKRPPHAQTNARPDTKATTTVHASRPLEYAGPLSPGSPYAPDGSI